MRTRNLAVLLLCVCTFGAPALLAQQTETEPAYKNPKLPIETRVNDLISRMTLEEKITQLQHTADAIPRLDVPAYNWWNEGLHGVARAGYATVFPQAIGLAATFDEPLMHRVAGVISTEFRAKYYANLHKDGSSDWYHGLTIWSPNINIFRDPRWGRGQETYGEDPFLTSRMGVAFVTGLQGSDPSYLKTLATSKHFAVHSGPESTRHIVNVLASRHDMEDTYFPAFRATVMEGKVGSVMCAYNSLNGQPACANSMLLQEHLRHDWDFQGYVVSDCGAATDISEGHHYTKTFEAGIAAAFKTGMDLICVYPDTRGQRERIAILADVKSGLLSEADIDRSLRRLFTARFRLGMFDPASLVPYSSIAPTDFDTEEHHEIALQASRESLVLLKNKDNFLPLKETPKTIAVIGPNADSLEALVGNYNGIPSHPVTILSGIRSRFPNAKVLYAPGTGWVGPPSLAVPSTVLFTDDTLHEHGLSAVYYPNVNLHGVPSLTRTDAAVDYSWVGISPFPSLKENFSVRWSGVLVAPATGDYEIGFTGNNGYRVWIDGKVLFEDWNWRGATTKTASIRLEKDHHYQIAVEFFHGVGDGQARLFWTTPEDAAQTAVDAANQSDLVIMVLGLSPTIEGEEMKIQLDGFSGGDRTKLDLPQSQKQLLERICALGKPTVLVLLNGGALAVNWAAENVAAILEAWYPGGQGGTAVAEAIAGDFSPAGRLPVTFYKSIDQLPPFDDYSMADRTYRYFQGEPLYPFGYGLSYTSFAYSKPRVDHKKIAADGAVTVSVEVTNTGATASDEVVQLYLMHPGVPGAPLRALQGFQRIHFDRGEKKTVSFHLQGRDLSIVVPEGVRRIVPGKVNVWVGGGQPVTPPGLPPTSGVSTQFTITSASTMPD
jgi:beta-glucosidase